MQHLLLFTAGFIWGQTGLTISSPESIRKLDSSRVNPQLDFIT